ncbi:MAG: ATP-binding protein, partial [Rickettsiales bacterium]|nr:ATP-binding protein [Rickettsiales bacterium]
MSIHMRDNLQLEAYRDIKDDVVESDFVPYACLVDPNTILTKNGEVMQIIKITGFTYELLCQDDADLRKVVRAAIKESVDTDEYAVWFHTLRRKKNLSPDGDYPDPFSEGLHKAWKERNAWDRKFTNELYITIVKESQTADITSVKGFFEGLLPMVDRKIRNIYIDRIAEELDVVVTKFLSYLEDFGARRLTSVKRNGRYYGEHLEFLEKLINLEERPMPITREDLSTYLTTGEMSFAFNAMEVRTPQNKRRFGSVLTIKEYKEASLYRVDEFLQLPCEFIVTQCIDFINADEALSVYEFQEYLMEVSGDDDLAESAELNRILDEDNDSDLDYGEQQTTIFVIGESIKELEANVKMIRKNLSKSGIVTIREDLKFEECYWAILPANFEFISRLEYTNTQHVAGFVNIHNYPAGNAKGCPWGVPVTLFYTAAGTPYFFNFHIGKNGHTSVVGPYGSGKSVLLNFLISESRKYKTRLFYMDAHGSARKFVKAIGGNYYDLHDPNSAYHHLGPLHLQDSKANRDFLTLWLTTLVDPNGASIDNEMIALFRETVNQMYELPDNERTMHWVVETLATQRAELAEKLAKWHGMGEYGFYFDHEDESVQPNRGMIGFNISQFIDNPEVLVPVTSYLLHRITMTLDGTPSILVLDEAFKIMNSPLFAPRIKQWMTYLTSKNTLAIMTT